MDTTLKGTFKGSKESGWQEYGGYRLCELCYRKLNQPHIFIDLRFNICLNPPLKTQVWRTSAVLLCSEFTTFHIWNTKIHSFLKNLLSTYYVPIMPGIQS